MRCCSPVRQGEDRHGLRNGQQDARPVRNAAGVHPGAERSRGRGLDGCGAAGEGVGAGAVGAAATGAAAGSGGHRGRSGRFSRFGCSFDATAFDRLGFFDFVLTARFGQGPGAGITFLGAERAGRIGPLRCTLLRRGRFGRGNRLHRYRRGSGRSGGISASQLARFALLDDHRLRSAMAEILPYMPRLDRPLQRERFARPCTGCSRSCRAGGTRAGCLVGRVLRIHSVFPQMSSGARCVRNANFVN